MKSLLFVVTAASAMVVAATASGVEKLQEDRRPTRRRWRREIQATTVTEDEVNKVAISFKCDIPSSGTGCQYGLFNTTSCTCDCIQPFCTDVSSGECTTATQCPNDPFESCVRGLNCPWWVNPLNSESCTTGPLIPVGVWSIYNTQDICCKINFPYSTVCFDDSTASPSKYPTIDAVLPGDDFDPTETEVIPLRFDIFGLPTQGLSVEHLHAEVKIVMQRIILLVAKDIEGLSVTKIEEKALPVIYNDGHNTLGYTTGKSIYYLVYVVLNEKTKFGPLLIQALRDGYNEVLEEVAAIPDITLFTEDVAFNICGMQEGKYTLCAKEELSPSPNPSPISLTSSELASSSIIPSYVGDDAFVSSNDDVAGFALWVIALIVIVALLSVCCAGYAVAVVYCGVSNCLDFTKNEDTNTVKSSFFYDERTIGGTHQRLKNLTIENSSNWDKGRSQKTSARRILSLGENGREMLQIEDGSHFHHNAGSLALTTITLGTRAQRRAGRDPTMYIPGQEEKPDPDGTLTILQVHNDSRNLSASRSKDYPKRKSRDPTFYDSRGSTTVAQDQGASSKVSSKRISRDPTFHESRGTTTVAEDRGISSKDTSKQESRDPTFYDSRGPTTVADDQYNDQRRKPGGHNRWKLIHSLSSLSLNLD